MGGFTEGVRRHHDAAREKDFLIVLIGRDDLDQLVTAPDPNEVLEQLHERAIAERSGV